MILKAGGSLPPLPLARFGGDFNLGPQEVFRTYSPIACFPVIPAAWGWKLYLIKDRQPKSSSIVNPLRKKSRRVGACGLVDEVHR